MLDDGAAAEDATQETFMRVHRHLARACTVQEALSWIYRIATNYCLNELRDRKLRPQPTSHRMPEVGATPNLERTMADRAAVRWIAAAVPEKLRIVAWLHYVEGMAQPEVAEVLKISRRTVVYRLEEFNERARKLLERSSA
jgi:RNA polymerase sigma-70 factor (ECF subfamily)